MDLSRVINHEPDDLRLKVQPAATHPIAFFLEPDSVDALEEQSEHTDDFSSITSSIIDYEFENGRRYHAYKAGYYPLPNDESELDRLDLQHHVITLLLDGELHLAPLRNPRRVLDIGTGTGLWAIEMADRFPGTQVTGTDLSPVQPTWVPDNIVFEIDDVESEWLYPENRFDLIHSRYMIGAIGDWKSMIRKAFKHCKPGGFLEVQELDPALKSDDGTDELSKYHHEYIELICKASKKYGKPVPSHTDFKTWLEEAGFVDVEERFYKIPVSSWPKDKKLKEIGKYQCLNYTEGLEGISIGLFTRVLNWQPMEFSVFLARIRAELKDKNIHCYQRFAVVIGRKPLPYEREERTLSNQALEPQSLPRLDRERDNPPRGIEPKTLPYEREQKPLPQQDEDQDTLLKESEPNTPFQVKENKPHIKESDPKDKATTSFKHKLVLENSTPLSVVEL